VSESRDRWKSLCRSGVSVEAVRKPLLLTSTIRARRASQCVLQCLDSLTHSLTRSRCVLLNQRLSDRLLDYRLPRLERRVSDDTVFTQSFKMPWKRIPRLKTLSPENN